MPDISDKTKVSDKSKKISLSPLDLKHEGTEEVLSSEPKKITLKRQSKIEIKVQRSSGRKSTVSVVRKRRHIYVKKDAGEGEVLEEDLASEVSATPSSNLEATKEEIAEVSMTSNVLGAKESAEIKEFSDPKELNLSEAALFAEVPSNHSKKEESTTPNKKGRTTRDLLDEEEKKRNRNKPKNWQESDEWHKGKVVNVKVLNIVNEGEEVEDEITTPYLGWRSQKAKTKSSKALSSVKGQKKDIKGIVEEIQKKHTFEKPTGPFVREVLIPETITVAELAQKMSIKTSEVMKNLIKLGIMATINQSIDQETAVIVVEEMGHIPKPIKDAAIEETLQVEEGAREKLSRAAVVTVMGHVDHGKTSLLDCIRRTKVAAKEAGGITQHIGAYHVETSRGAITFLDTPGHAAFTAMRARGVQCTDIVVLVVAADDGVMPQTIEAIQHAKAANVPIVVAINKIDKKDADLDRLRNELSVHGLISEAWGGDVMFVPVSAREEIGMDALLEAIGLQAEMLELKAFVDGNATGVVLEARLDRGRGPVASLLVQNGTLRRGDMLLAGLEYGRIRAMIDEFGQQVTSVGPAMPVEVLGLSNTPQAGDTFTVVADERKAREVALFRQNKHRDVRMLRQQSSKLEGFLNRMQQEEFKTLKIILKTDVQGSSEALMEALEGLSTDKVKVKIVMAGVGGINESDISLAMASSAVVIGFNVRADVAARRLAEKEGIEIHYNSIIYDIVDNIKRAVHGLLGPQFKEEILGLAEVRSVFRSAKLGAIAGCMIIEGNVKRGYPIRVLRNNVVIYQGELESLRRFKEDVLEVRHGTECGVGVKNYNDVKVGDQIEVYETVEVSRG